jgi:hypothetical protein
LSLALPRPWPVGSRRAGARPVRLAPGTRGTPLAHTCPGRLRRQMVK